MADIFRDLFDIHGDWLIVACNPMIGTGWSVVVAELLEGWASIARRRGITVRLVRLSVRHGALDVLATSEASDAAQVAMADLQTFAMLKSQGVCETCGDRGWMRLSRERTFYARCDEHSEPMVRLADQRIWIDVTDGSRGWRVFYEPESGTSWCGDVVDLREG